jgi:hypothetical protein
MRGALGPGHSTFSVGLVRDESGGVGGGALGC